MKKLLYIFFLTVLIWMNGVESYSYDKLSIVERFTNASCGPCATINNAWYNAVTHELVNSGAISHIIYNGWWPGAGDPMYLLNQTDNTTRINYYGVNAVPWIDVNGTTISTSQAALENAVNNGNASYSPFQITVAVNEFSQSLLKYTVTITRDPGDVTTFGNNVKLRFGLTEKTVAFSSPPGSNGESVFYSVCRKMLPDAGGTLLTIPSPGESTDIVLEYVPTSQFLSSVIMDSIRVVAFVQDDATKNIYQSFMAENYSSSVEQTSADVIGENTSPGEFTTSVFNSGLLDDSYNVHVDMDAPAGWTGEYTTINGTFNFDQTDEIQVPSNTSGDISISVDPAGNNGFAEINVQFVSVNNPQLISTATMRMVTLTGVNGLVIDASGRGYSDLVLPVLDQEFPYTTGIVSRDALYDGIDLSNFNLIVWSAGDAYPVFNDFEVTALQSYLDIGGRLLIDGQNIGEDIFDPNGQSQFAQSFYNDYLHADYVDTWGHSYLVNGIDGDPISDQIVVSFSGIYDRSPDQVAPHDNYGTALFTFGTTSNYSGIRSDDGNTRVVYFSFGFEQISNQDARDTLIARSVRWLMDGVAVGVKDNQNSISTFNLQQNYPNPFNPTTKIKYSIPEASLVSLKVYDILGNEVASLVNQEKQAGTYEVQFNATSLSSGVYLYKIKSGSFVQTKKMIVLK